jgi:phosphatidylserine decarboxylase
MIWSVFISSLVISLIILPLLAWKWKIKLIIAVAGAVIIGALTGFVVNWLVYTPLKLNLPATIIVELIFILIVTFILAMYRFYRNPERTPPETENVILSPADGKIIYISPVTGPENLISTKGKRRFKLEEIISTDLLNDAGFLIGIEMNLLNVHVNRAPIGGRIVLQKHISGRFMSLGKPESEVLNERVSTIVDNGAFRIGIVQIASRLVRQIVSYLKEGDPVNPGQRIGMIRFGSQVDVAVPALHGLKINVRIGDTVQAGTTVLARYGTLEQ